MASSRYTSSRRAVNLPLALRAMRGSTQTSTADRLHAWLRTLASTAVGATFSAEMIVRRYAAADLAALLADGRLVRTAGRYALSA